MNLTVIIVAAKKTAVNEPVFHAMEALSAQSLPPGFGFHPTDIELISHYLKRKILGLKIDYNVIPEIDIYKQEPWDLPAKCNVPTRDCKWHFFASRDKKYPNGSRSNRTTEAGYWKSTGKDRSIRYQNRVIGTKKTLVFHEGRPPSGKRTDWIMHEYYINESECKASPEMKDAFVLCRVTKRNGWGLDGGENVSTGSENVHASAIEREVLALPVVPEKSSSPSESAEDIEAWLSELFDPNPCIGEVKSEPEEGISSIGLDPEPLNPNPLLEASDDSHTMFLVDEFCDILQSEAQGYDVFGDIDVGSMSSFGYTQEDLFAGLTNDGEFAPNAWTGIQRREREPKPHHGTPNQRIRLQVRKMESRNGGEPLSGTIQVDRSVHLDQHDDGKHAASESKPCAGAPKGGGLMRGLRDSFARCSSASMNCFFLLACGMGTAALILCFLLRDVRRFVGSFAELEL